LNAEYCECWWAYKSVVGVFTFVRACLLLGGRFCFARDVLQLLGVYFLDCGCVYFCKGVFAFGRAILLCQGRFATSGSVFP
jgi:hypothetical protein